MTCEFCQQNLLPFLFDLLDPEELRQMETHLASCPDCAGSLDTARRQQALLKEAACQSFPEVRFDPDKQPTLPFSAPRREVAWGRRLLVAACLFLMVGGGAVGSLLGWKHYHDGHAQLLARQNQARTTERALTEKIHEHRRRNQEEIKKLQNDVNEVVQVFKKKEVEQRNLLVQEQNDVVVTGPSNIQAGAANNYDVQMNYAKSGNGQATVRVVNEDSRAVLYEQQVPAQGRVQIALPANLPVPGPGKLALEFAGPGQKVVKASERLALDKLRYLTHLATDRPMYRPGDTVHFRSLTLERFTLQPAQEELHLRFRIVNPQDTQVFFREGKARLVDGAGKDVLGPDGQPLRGLATGEFTLPKNLAGGTYVLTVSEAHDRFPPERRTFTVNQWQRPLLNKELTFHRKSYGPGESVTIHARASRVQGEPVAAQVVHFQGRVDDTDLPANNGLRTDEDGQVSVSFVLPQKIERGRGSVSMTFFDGGSSETIVRDIPIVTDRLAVDFYPEGGDLIAGVPNRVYFQVRNSMDKPAELTGKIVERLTGQVMAQIGTLNDDKEPGLNQGMGSFAFTPQSGGTYQLMIDSPTGIKGEHVLPRVRPAGVVLHVPHGVVEDAIAVKVTSVGKDRQLLIGAYCRGGLLDQAQVEAKKGVAVSVDLKTSPSVSGVHRVTVFEVLGERLVPVAERLVYRRHAQKLRIGVQSQKKVYQPGDKVELSLRTGDEADRPAPAVLMVAVVDKALLQLADEKTFRTLPTHFLLTSEIRRPEDLEYADFLLGTHPRAAQALDLLLGTQGWRRFAEQDPEKFARFRGGHNRPRETDRLLLAMGSRDRETNSLRTQAIDRIDQEYGSKFIALQKQLADKEKQQEGPEQLLMELGQCVATVNQNQDALKEAKFRLERFEEFIFNLGNSAVVIAVLLIGIGLLMLGTRRLNQGKSARMPFLLGGTILGCLIVFSLFGVMFLSATRERDDHWGGRGRGRTFTKVAGGAQMAGKEDARLEMEPFAPVEQFQEQFLPEGNEVKKMDDGNAVVEMQMDAQLNLLQVARERLAEGGEFANQGVIRGDVPVKELANPIDEEPRFIDEDSNLRRQGNFEQILRLKLGRPVRLPVALDAFVVREYAHQHVPRGDEVRRDFSELLCWQPALVSADGKANLTFDLSDASTRFQVLVMGHTHDGRLGATTFEFTSRLPVSVEPLVPFEITSGDKVHLPVTLANDGADRVTANVKLNADGLNQVDKTAKEITLEPGQRGRLYFPVIPNITRGKIKLGFAGQFGPLGADKVERVMHVVPEGFPVAETHSGLLEKTVKHTLTLPDNWVKGTLQCKVEVFPSVLADLHKGLEGLLREPCGCFEQSSSSNYPNVLILDYLQETKQSRPDVENQARRLMHSGYGQLTSFECVQPGQANKKEGYEWFGQTAAPHEALTAYGLLQFKDMARFYPVDEEMLRRTRGYLLGQRDGKGGFKRNPRSLDSFGRAPPHITSAYIVWALTETGNDDLTPEIDALLKRARDSRDPYFLALVSLGLLNVNRTEDGLDLLRTLGTLQDKAGLLKGAETSITGSGGRDLQVETSALAILAWLKANRPDLFQTGLNKAIGWLARQRTGQGGFGATQSTILALKALVAHTRAVRQASEGGEIQVQVDTIEPGKLAQFARSFSEKYPAGRQDPIVIDVPLEKDRQFRPGPTAFTIEHVGRNNFPYAVTLSYQTLKPANPADCPVHLSASLSKNSAREGDTVRLGVVVENKTGQGQGMAVAVLGIPAGLTLPEDLSQLKDLARLRDDGTKPGVISSFEIRGQGREVVLYWRDLAPQAKIEVDLDLICRIPGDYRAPASRAYLYYSAEKKFWADPLGISIRE